MTPYLRILYSIWDAVSVIMISVYCLAVRVFTSMQEKAPTNGILVPTFIAALFGFFIFSVANMNYNFCFFLSENSFLYFSSVLLLVISSLFLSSGRNRWCLWLGKQLRSFVLFSLYDSTFEKTENLILKITQKSHILFIL